MGIYQKTNQFKNCNIINYEYLSFSYICFKELNNSFYSNLYSNLNNFFHQNKENNLICNKCLKKEIKQKFSIFICPKILTILLKDFDNYNYIIEDEIDLKQYAINYIPKSEGIYKLISILCYFKNSNKYITYFLNIYNGLWYKYTNDIITQVEIMDINVTPLMLLYEIKIIFHLIIKL